MSSPSLQSLRGGGGLTDSGSVSYVNERGQDKDKPSTPSKEELELNERNLAKENTTSTSTTTTSPAATKLGKLHFKLR